MVTGTPVVDVKPRVQGRLVTGSEMAKNQGFKVTWLPGQR